MAQTAGAKSLQIPAWMIQTGRHMCEETLHNILPFFITRSDLPERFAVLSPAFVLILTVKPITRDLTDLSESQAAAHRAGFREVQYGTPEFFTTWDMLQLGNPNRGWQSKVPHEMLMIAVLQIAEQGKIALLPLTAQAHDHVASLGEQLYEGTDFSVIRPVPQPLLEIFLLRHPLVLPAIRTAG